MSITGDATTNFGLINIKGRLTVIPMRDKTLSKDGYAADAKVVGEALASLRERIDDIDSRCRALEEKG